MKSKSTVIWALSALALSLAVGCGTSSPAPGLPAPDTGTTDTSNNKPDTQAETTPPKDAITSLCGLLPNTFACKAFDKSKDAIEFQKNACTFAQADQFVKDCFGQAATAETCGPWFEGELAETPCGQCVLAWTPDNSLGNIQCLYNILGEGDATKQAECAGALKCSVSCSGAVCNDNICNDTKKDSNGDTELDRCRENLSEDACTGIKTADGKDPDAVLGPCVSNNIKTKAGKYCLGSNLGPQASLGYFFRFTCSLGGDYTQPATAVNTPAFGTAGDAGPVPTDSSTTDTATTDSAATDSATTDAATTTDTATTDAASNG